MELRVWRRRRVLLAALLGMALVGCGTTARDQSTAEFVDDAVVTARVKARLAQEPGMSAFAIGVETLNGVVLLSGFVDNETQRERAIAAARAVAGVRDVKAGGLALTPGRRSN